MKRNKIVGEYAAEDENGKVAPGTPAALRALRRAAQKVHTANRKLGLPVIIWQHGKVVEKPA